MSSTATFSKTPPWSLQPNAAHLIRGNPKPVMGPHINSALFLDFDGVLHPAVPEGEKVRYFEWATTLADALRGQDRLGLVVHSTWRYIYDPAELAQMLRPVDVPLLGVVPRGPRYESILWWLHLNPSIQNYRIVDDASAEFPSPAPPELILCQPLRGASDPAVLKALQDWLTGRRN